eukprot:m.890763 g.890763  ORF g.890763 m.890763 type:complete len:215 (-) comp23652_c1_seq15:168-812(-)
MEQQLPTEENPGTREPCPWRVVEDAGSAFAMGSIGGSIYHAIKGWNNSPRQKRLMGMMESVRMRAPALGGSFAVWGFMFSSFDCSLMAIRDVDDPYNAIASGFLTGGTLAIRNGPRAALVSATFGGVILAFIEGLGIYFKNQVHEQQTPVMPDLPADPLGPMPLPPPPPPGGSYAASVSQQEGIIGACLPIYDHARMSLTCGRLVDLRVWKPTC